MSVVLIVVVEIYNGAGLWCWCWCPLSSPSSDPGRGTGPCLVAHSSAVKAAHYERYNNKYIRKYIFKISNVTSSCPFPSEGNRAQCNIGGGGGGVLT